MNWLNIWGLLWWKTEDIKYLSEFCDVKYEEKHNVVFVEWKKFCCREDYRKPLEYALDIIKNHKGCNYVADTRNGFENIPEDTEWVAQCFMPKAKEYGCKIIYFIIDVAPLSAWHVTNLVVCHRINRYTDTKE